MSKSRSDKLFATNPEKLKRENPEAYWPRRIAQEKEALVRKKQKISSAYYGCITARMNAKYGLFETGILTDDGGQLYRRHGEEGLLRELMTEEELAEQENYENDLWNNTYKALWERI
jgi:hypothetical protein